MSAPEETPSKIPPLTWVVDLPLFILLASLANPFAFIGPRSSPQIILCLIAWFILSKRYSIWELCREFGHPRARILRWVYFGVLLITGWQVVGDSELNLLRPARYSVYYYAYGIQTDYDDEGRTTAYASHVICKGPYRLSGDTGYDGFNEVPDEVEGAELDGTSREDFFFWQASGTDKAKNEVSLPVRCVYSLLDEFVSYTLPDFVLLGVLLAALTFHRKTKPSLRFLAEALTEYRTRPT